MPVISLAVPAAASTSSFKTQNSEAFFEPHQHVWYQKGKVVKSVRGSLIFYASRPRGIIVSSSRSCKFASRSFSKIMTTNIYSSPYRISCENKTSVFAVV